jgi:hypothetical protein
LQRTSKRASHPPPTCSSNEAYSPPPRTRHEKEVDETRVAPESAEEGDGAGPSAKSAASPATVLRTGEAAGAGRAVHGRGASTSVRASTLALLADFVAAVYGSRASVSAGMRRHRPHRNATLRGRLAEEATPPGCWGRPAMSLSFESVVARQRRQRVPSRDIERRPRSADSEAPHPVRPR